MAVAVAGVATNRGLKALDIAIIAMSAAFLVLVSVSMYAAAAPASVVISSDKGDWIYPLSDDRTLEIEGLIGTTVIRIQDGKAWIIDSPCENKTCVASPPVSRTGDWSACLPNGVFVRTDGSGAGDAVDATVR